MSRSLRTPSESMSNVTRPVKHLASAYIDEDLAFLRPSKAKPWRFVFVVSLVKVTKQELEGDTDRGEWDGKVVQYVSGFEVKSRQNST
jgi:hypothetical protein